MIFGLMQICFSPLCTRAKNVCSYIYSPLDANKELMFYMHTNKSIKY